jgi:thioredoxin 1
MNHRKLKNWAGPAVLTLLGVGGVYAYGQFAAGSPATPAGRRAAVHQTKGEAMSTQVQNAIVYASEQTFREQVINSEVPVLVDFYADWCGPCRALSPVLEELAQETPDAKIVKVNVDESPQLAGQYGISSIPALLVFNDGKITGQQVGLASKQQLKSLLVGKR